MSTTFSDAPPTEWTAADVRARLGGVLLERIHTCPARGTATEETEEQSEETGPTGSLSAGDVLPGFELSPDNLFGWAEKRREG